LNKFRNFQNKHDLNRLRW